MDTNLDNLLFNKKEHYIDITRKIRWLAIALVLLTFPPDNPYYAWFILLAVGAIVYNIAWYYRPIYRQEWFGSFISMNLSDNLFVGFLVVISGGLFSPYYILFTFMAITLTYWYGYRGLMVLSGFHAVFAFLVWHFVSAGEISPDLLRVPVILLFTFIINGILTERLTQGDRREREHIISANRKIDAERQRLLSLVNSMGDGVIAINEKGKILMYNGASLGILDTNQQLIDESLQKFMQIIDSKDENVSLMKIVNEVKTVERYRDLRLKVDDGSFVSLDLTISPIKGSNANDDAGYILIMRDITKEKTIEESRDEFISVTSHELRTPIAIAEANLSTAMMPKFAPNNEKGLELLTKAHENIKFLGSLVNDLSTLAKAERDSLKLDLSMVNPTKIVEQLEKDYREQALEKDLELKTEIADDVPKVLSSSFHIKEILQNFITNSIKYTQKGEVTIGVFADNDNKGNNRSVIFTVADTGIGISASDKKKIYQKFYRSEDYRTRETGGTGLGLYITQKLADRLNGMTWFDSKLNKGSTFYLKIPVVTKHEKDKKQVAEVQVDDFVTTL